MERKQKPELCDVPQNLPVADLELAKALVEKALKKHKIFSIRGSYPTVRAALRARGWVERCLPGTNHSLVQPGRGDKGKRDDDDSGSDEEETKDDQDKLHHLMSQMVENEKTFLFWTRRPLRDTHLTKKQMSNHYRRTGCFATKGGLCDNLKNLPWFEAEDPDTFFPRCYKLGTEHDKQDFIEDFRMTACTSLLQHVVEKNQKGIKQDDQVKQQLTKGYKQKSLSIVPSRVLNSALEVCENFLDCLEHKDIDMTLTPPLTEKQWTDFLQSYYQAVHDGMEIENSAAYVDRCQAMLQRLREVRPQMDIDGTKNMWIVKPESLSRGRGIVCQKQLENILKMVKSSPMERPGSKWVVQKYTERPFLIKGTKIDLRQWFLVTNWNPLTVWFYKRSYIRFSTKPYTTDCLDRLVHLCNNSIHKHLQPSPSRDPELPEESMWCCHRFRDFLASQGKENEWDNNIIPRMKKAIIHVLKTCQEQVENRPGSFQMFGADFVFGEDLKPWLLEINSSPSMNTNTAVKAELCRAVQEDTLRVVLDRKVNRRAHTGDFELLYEQAAIEVPKYYGLNLLIKGTKIKRRRRPLVYRSECRTGPRSISPRSFSVQQQQHRGYEEPSAEKSSSSVKSSIRTADQGRTFKNDKLIDSCRPPAATQQSQVTARPIKPTPPSTSCTKPSTVRARVTKAPVENSKVFESFKHQPVNHRLQYTIRSPVTPQQHISHREAKAPSCTRPMVRAPVICQKITVPRKTFTIPKLQSAHTATVPFRSPQLPAKSLETSLCITAFSMKANAWPMRPHPPAARKAGVTSRVR